MYDLYPGAHFYLGFFIQSYVWASPNESSIVKSSHGMKHVMCYLEHMRPF